MVGSLRDEKSVFMTIPYYHRSHWIRLIPVQKRIIRTFKTKDGKYIEVMALIRMEPQVWNIPLIFNRFGKDYAKGFIEQECAFDVEMFVKENNFDDLVANDQQTDVLLKSLAERFLDAAAFHKIKLFEAVVTFRKPPPESEIEVDKPYGVTHKQRFWYGM
eukprot:GHVN01063594.1.p1 GENE.GHVN01063594.1~~GHVN01063594.1.p1  ORF type:complete len:160 (+),score=30.36 GHVN01063594.1:422-901(+)